MISIKTSANIETRILNIKVMKVFSVLLFLMISLSTYGQGDLIKNWKSYPAPKDRETISEYIHDKNEWYVYIDEGEIKVIDIMSYFANYRIDPKTKLPFEIKQSESKFIDTSAPLYGVSDVMKVDNGYLVGFNRGEWGGELYWFSKRGKRKYEISGHQIVQFMKRDNKIYACEGYDDVFFQGSIIEIKKIKRKWVAEEYLNIPAPRLVQLDSKENFIIVNVGLPFMISVDREANIEALIDTNLTELFPYSMVIQNDVVYIGMRKGVYKYDLATKKEEFLLPK